ncbi:MAG: sulfatase [Balneolales bacterium]
MLVFFLCISCSYPESNTAPSRAQPNVVLIFLDDAGWDFKPFAETRYPTPNIKKLSEVGRRFYNFYVPQAVCSASRAALLTGTYPERNGLFGAHVPGDRGLDPDFVTIGEMLQDNGYSTAFFGKWHIGDHPETRPPERGFDESSGIMYSNDMWAEHPTNPEFWGQHPLRYWENGTIAIDSVTSADQRHLTTWFTENSVDFITRNSDNPFFLYLPHPMPHVPLFVSEKFEGASGTGLFGDVIMELDWSVGEVMKALEANGVSDNTIVIFTSDNGPWLPYGNHSGKTPYREGKRTAFDGGIRVPLIISYPGAIEPNSVSHDTFFSIDFMPTIAELTGSVLPDYEIDGKNVWDLIAGKPGTGNPHDYYSITTGDELQGIISSDGNWKLILPHDYVSVVDGGRDGQPGYERKVSIPTSLFDLVHDPFEKGNVIEQYPDTAEELLRFAEYHKLKFFDK